MIDRRAGSGGVGPEAPDARLGRVALPLGLAVLAALPFLPILRNGFLDWDDTGVLTELEARVRQGDAVSYWLFHTDAWGHYGPVRWLAWTLDFRLFGSWAGGYHLTSLVVHALNVGLVYLLARRLLAAAGAGGPRAVTVGAAGAALFFGIHPLRVESVAWISERGGLLAAAFALVAVLAALEAIAARGGRRRWWRGLSLAAFALALGSKATVIALPLVLVVLDVYPLRRLPADPRRWLAGPCRSVWGEKLGYAILALGWAILTTRIRTGRGDTTMLDPVTWGAVVVATLWFPVAKTLLPLDLSPLYQLTGRVPLGDPATLARALGVGGIAAAVVAGRARWPAGLAAAVAFGLLLAPVMGALHAGRQLTADRYSYLPAVAGALLVGGALARLAGAAARGTVRPGLVVLAFAAAAGWGTAQAALTWRQSGAWRDTATFWAHAVAATPECALCRRNLGIVLLGRQDPGAAVEQLQIAVRLDPAASGSHGDLGRALAVLGRHDEAVVHYARLLAVHPRRFDIRAQLASSLVATGRPAEAIAQIREAVRLEQAGEVTAYFRWARDQNPAAAVVRLGLVEAYRATGRPDLAAPELEALQRLAPGLAAALPADPPHGS